MSLTARRVTAAAIMMMISIAAVQFVCPISAKADPILTIQLDTVYAYPGQQDVVFPIYMKNLADTVAGYALWIMLDQPDVMQFNGQFDTSGTLTSGWEFVGLNTLGGNWYDAKIVGLANMPEEPYTTGILPQNGDMPLIKLTADINHVPDTTTDRYVVMVFMTDDVNHFQFSDPWGNLIGYYRDTILDTNYYECEQWAPPPNDTICFNWQQVPWPTDSMAVDTIIIPGLDTSLTEVISGAMVIHPCGDANGSGSVNILDITSLINYLYKHGTPPVPLEAGDPNGNGNLNALDITYLINYLYKHGPAPHYL